MDKDGPCRELDEVRVAMQLDDVYVINGSGPFAVDVADVRFLARFPGSDEELWAADIQAGRRGSAAQIFKSVLFAEGSGVASIYGITSPDGYPKGLADGRALGQQAFIAFLRGESARNERLFGPTVRIFSSHEYSSELLVTRAYISARGSTLDAGIGYHDTTAREYILRIVEAEREDAVSIRRRS